MTPGLTDATPVPVDATMAAINSRSIVIGPRCDVRHLVDDACRCVEMTFKSIYQTTDDAHRGVRAVTVNLLASEARFRKCRANKAKFALHFLYPR